MHYNFRWEARSPTSHLASQRKHSQTSSEENRVGYSTWHHDYCYQLATRCANEPGRSIIWNLKCYCEVIYQLPLDLICLVRIKLDVSTQVSRKTSSLTRNHPCCESFLLLYQQWWLASSDLSRLPHISTVFQTFQSMPPVSARNGTHEIPPLRVNFTSKLLKLEISCYWLNRSALG